MIAEFVRKNSVTNGKRMLIYGAGDKGEFALREIVNKPRLESTPVGFINDGVKNSVIGGAGQFGRSLVM